MAKQLYFSRDTKVYLEFNGVVWDIPVLDGFSFSQGNESTEITLAEMEDSAGLSRRGRRAFNTALSPGEWSLSTYVRPFKSAGSGTGKADDTAQVHAVEEVLWGLFLGAREWDSNGFVMTSDNITVKAGAVGSDGLTQNEKYIIDTAGDTNWTSIGAAAATVGTIFTRNGTAATGSTGIARRLVNDPAASSSAFNAQSSNRSSLGTCNIYMVLGDQHRSVYKLKDSVVNEATIDFDIDGIATINWSGQCSEVNDVTGNVIEHADSDVKFNLTVNQSDHALGDTTVTVDSVGDAEAGDFISATGIPANTTISSISGSTITLSAATTAALADNATLKVDKATRDGTKIADNDVLLDTSDGHRLSIITDAEETEVTTTPVFEDVTETDNFIRNRLSQLTVALDSSQQDPDNDSTNEFQSSYNLTLTGGSLSFANNLTYITPEELGVVNTPFAHVTGTRTIGGSFTCYLTLDSDSQDGSGTQSRDLFDDLRNASNVVTNSFDLTFKIGGGSGNRLEVNIPTAHIEIPQHSIEDVISMETTFMALPSTVSETDEMTLTYKV